MNFTFETQGTNTYLVYQVGDEDRIDSMSLGMLTNNKIPGLASTIFTQMDMTKYVKFNVSAKISVKQFFNGPVNKKRLIGVFNGIVDAMLSSEEYMIDPSSILLDLEYIFADVSTCETILICVPLEGYSNGVKLGDFFKNIMFNTQFDQTENCDHVAKLMNYLNSSPVFSLDEFKKVLESISTSSAPEVKKVDVAPATDKGGSNQPKVNGGTTPPANGGTVNNGGSNQPKVNGGTVPPSNGGLSGVATPPPANNGGQLPPKKEKKPGLFAGLFKKDADKQKTQPAKKPANAGGNPSYPVPGMEVGGMAIPGQPDPIVEKKPAGGGQTVNNGGAAKPATTTNGGTQSGGTTPPVTPRGHAANFGETTVLNKGNIGETTVLNAAAQQQQKQIAPHLIRAKNNEKISVNKPVFRIGKERSYVDYFIGDNTAISRSHANIVTRDGAYYLVDTNSTNHSFVNGEMIPSNEEVRIEHGTKIMLANEDFEFRLY